jgi:hypothetical protein
MIMILVLLSVLLKKTGMCVSDQWYKIIKESWKKKSVMLHIMEWLDFLSAESLGMCDKMKASQPKIGVK